MKILDLYHRKTLRSNMEIIFCASLNHSLKLHRSDLFPSVLRSFLLNKTQERQLTKGYACCQSEEERL